MRRDLLPRAFSYATGAVRNRLCRESLIGEAPVVVSITSHGRRLRTVHHTLESIGSGKMLPQRLILVLDSADDVKAAAALRTLRRLRRRGLEIIESPPMGPHAKYFPYVASVEKHTTPLVTADDDITYPCDWLAGLLAAFDRDPDVIHCYRAHEFGIEDGRPASYTTWASVTDVRPRYRTFLTGVSGVIYPPSFLDHLREAGELFRSVAPKADDVWLHARAVEAEVKVAQIQSSPRHFPVLIGSQMSALWRHNTHTTGPEGNSRTANDVQIEQAYSEKLIRRIVSEGDATAGCEQAGRPEEV